MDWLNERRPRVDEGLLPVVVQDADSREVLMLAWANAEALAATQKTGEAHFWSRSRKELWRKGATSGHVMEVVQLATDCDGHALRYLVRPTGPACHTGARSCFGDGDDAEQSPAFDLRRLEAVIASRGTAEPHASYTARLLADGPRRPAEKLVEEAGEVAAAALVGTADELREEAADLLYHLLVLLAARDVRLDTVIGTLGIRHESRRD